MYTRYEALELRPVDRVLSDEFQVLVFFLDLGLESWALAL